MGRWTLAAILTVWSIGAQAGPIGFDHYSDGTHKAKYQSDSHRDRCSQMAPKVRAMPPGYCGNLLAQEIGAVWCDEARSCPFGLCNHYAYLRFRCIATNDQNTKRRVDERNMTVFDE